MLQIIQSFVNSYSKFGDDSPSQVKIKSFYDAKKSAKKSQWNSGNINDENFPSMQSVAGSEKEKGKKFGGLQMQSQGVHQGDNNPPPLEAIEEARENDEKHPSAKKDMKANFEGDHWGQGGVNVLPTGDAAIALPAADPQDSQGGSKRNDTFKYESDKKETYYRQVVNKWQGDTTDEVIESDIFTAQELI